MGILDNVFGRPRNPAKEANNYLNQIPGEARGAYNDYINRGKESGNTTHDIYQSFLDNPTELINKIMGTYKPSEGYQFQKKQLTSELGNTAAAGGIAGTPLDQMNQGKAIQGLLSQDMQEYLNNALGRFDTGLKGEQGEADRGYDATQKLYDAIAGALNQQGGLAFQDAQQGNSDRNARISALIKAIGGALGGAGGELGDLFNFGSSGFVT